MTKTASPAGALRKGWCHNLSVAVAGSKPPAVPSGFTRFQAAVSSGFGSKPPAVGCNVADLSNTHLRGVRALTTLFHWGVSEPRFQQKLFELISTRMRNFSTAQFDELAVRLHKPALVKQARNHNAIAPQSQRNHTASTPQA